MLKLLNKESIYYLIILLVITIFGCSKFIFPQVTDLWSKKSQIAEIQTGIKDLESKINQQQMNNMQQIPSAKTNLPVSIYKSPYLGLDIESSAGDLVDEFILMIKETGNNITEISFNAQSPSGSPGLLSLNMSLNCSFLSLQNLLQKVFIWKYLAAIKNISMIPAQDNSGNLTAKLTVDLYINNN